MRAVEAGGQGDEGVERVEGVEEDVGSEEAGEEAGAVVLGALVCRGGGRAGDVKGGGWDSVGEGEEGGEGDEAAVGGVWVEESMFVRVTVWWGRIKGFV